MAACEKNLEQARDQYGLTPKEAEFARLIAQGHTGAEAYRIAYQSEAKPEAVWASASQVRARAKVRLRIKDLLSQARLQDLDSIGEAIQRTKELIGLAADARNYSAAMKGNSDLLKMHGLLRDTLVVQWEQGLSDDQLVTRLAGNDPVRLEAARRLLSAPNSFDTPVIDVEPEDT